MTEEEDAENEERNKVVDACRHEPVTANGKRVWCRRCGCRFAVVMFPRIARFPAYDFDDDE